MSSEKKTKKIAPPGLAARPKKKAAVVPEAVAAETAGPAPRRKGKLSPGAAARAKGARAEAKRVRVAIMHQIAAQMEAGKHAAAWVAAIRNRVSELRGQFRSVLAAARADGSVLGLVLNQQLLAEVHRALAAADDAAAGLTVVGEDLPVPDIVRLESHLVEDKFRHAREGVRILARRAAAAEE